MGRAADSSNLADTPSLGAVALMEALAGFSGAPDASSTAAGTITGHAREQTAPPLPYSRSIRGNARHFLYAWLVGTTRRKISNRT
jgi:hypothetical protein